MPPRLLGRRGLLLLLLGRRPFAVDPFALYLVVFVLGHDGVHRSDVLEDDESEAARLVRAALHHDQSLLDPAKRSKVTPQLRFPARLGQTAHKDLAGPTVGRRVRGR